MSSGRVSFRDTLPPTNLALPCKSFSGKHLHAPLCMAYPVLSIGPEHRAASNQSESRMKKDRKETVASEPIGIVISRGDKTEPTPVFSAYIWGPVPDAAQDSATRAA